MSIKPKGLDISEEEELKIRCQVNEKIEEDTNYILNSIFKNISDVNKIIDERFGGKEKFFENAMDLNSIKPVDSILAPENEEERKTGYEKHEIQKVKESFGKWKQSLPQRGSVNSSWHPSSANGWAFVPYAESKTWRYNYIELVLRIYHRFHNILKIVRDEQIENEIQREIYYLLLGNDYSNPEEEWAHSKTGAGVVQRRTEKRHNRLRNNYNQAIIWLKKEIEATLKISGQDNSKKWETTLAIRGMIKDEPGKCGAKPPVWIREDYEKFFSKKMSVQIIRHMHQGPKHGILSFQKTEDDILKEVGEKPYEAKYEPEIRKKYLINLRRRLWWWIKHYDSEKENTQNSSIEK